MRLLEYEAKQLLKPAGIPTPASEVIYVNNPLTLSYPVVLKSQVPTGGRGKAGGILVVRDASEFTRDTAVLFSKNIKGYIPQSLLAEELIDIEQEFYVSFTINRATSSIELMSHIEGGIEIESRASEDFFRHTITSSKFDIVSDELADYLDIAKKAFVLENILENLYRCFIDNDCLLLEINPLILTKQGELIAGDCKMIIDDAALFRHPEWQFEDQPADANFVTLDKHGTVATIANGAGLAMATVDAVKQTGLVPANFLDIGGGATEEKILTCFKQIVQFPQVNAIIVNIFGGIVRCDVVAQAILDAKKNFPNLPPLYIRLTGNRSRVAQKLLEEQHIPLYKTLDECLEALR